MPVPVLKIWNAWKERNTNNLHTTKASEKFMIDFIFKNIMNINPKSAHDIYVRR